MPIIELNVVREKSHMPTLEVISQQFPKMGSAFAQFSLDRVLDSHTIVFAFVQYDSIITVREVLNEAHKDGSTA